MPYVRTRHSVCGSARWSSHSYFSPVRFWQREPSLQVAILTALRGEALNEHVKSVICRGLAHRLPEIADDHQAATLAGVIARR